MDWCFPGLGIVVSFDHGNVLKGVVAAIEAQQQRGAGQATRLLEHALKDRRGAFLAVLAAVWRPE